MRLRSHSPWILAALLAGCGSLQRSSLPTRPAIQRSELGEMRNVGRVEGIWSGGAPRIEDLDLARRRGVERVIALGEHAGSLGFDLGGVCLEIGLGCIELPTADPFAGGGVDEVLALLAAPHAPETLLFCVDGTVCAAVVALHRTLACEQPLDAAIEEARALGLTEEGALWVREEAARRRPDGI